MQEQINDKTIAVSVKSAKFTGKIFEQVLVKLLEQLKKRKNARDSPEIYKGQQTVKQLVGQGAGVSNIELPDAGIKRFRHIAKKYGVDFAVKKDASEKSARWIIFFKTRDKDVLQSAIDEYTSKIVKGKDKPSLIADLKENIEIAKNIAAGKVKNKRRELEL